MEGCLFRLLRRFETASPDATLSGLGGRVIRRHASHALAIMKLQRQFLLVALLVVPLLWWAWPSDTTSDSSGGGSPAETQESSLTRRQPQTTAEGGPSRTRSARDGQVTRTPLLGGSPEVDAVLSDDSISIEQAVERLRALAMDATHPPAQRLEALQHGLNLGIASFADFAQQPDLPAELASHFMDEVINYNESPGTQIRTYLVLMDHPDEEVASLAREMLAFQVDDDLNEATREQLIELARKKLEAE